MVDCPTCLEEEGSSKNFESKGSMRQHHSMVHNEHLPNRECNDCGCRFYDPKGEKKYCGDCDPFKGENNPNYSDANEESKCLSCGSIFDYYPSDKEGIFCPECVENDEIDTSYFGFSGKDNSSWKGGVSQEFYRKGWRKCRNKRLEMDDYTCQKCDRSVVDLDDKERLEVHHIIPVREFDKIRDAHTIDNTVTLCRSCHNKVENGEVEVPEN